MINAGLVPSAQKRLRLLVATARIEVIALILAVGNFRRRNIACFSYGYYRFISLVDSAYRTSCDELYQSSSVGSPGSYG